MSALNSAETLESLRKRIEVAAGRREPDLVIKNCKIVSVDTHEIIEGDIAISDDKIAGIGEYDGPNVIDAGGQYAMPGFVEGHIHIESSFCTPEEFSRLVVPHGTTTAIADPHEITNVAGLDGFDYMVRAAKKSAMDIKFMLPSCVPSTNFENAGAVINAADMEEPMADDKTWGLAEFMNSVGVINCDDECLNKILVAKKNGKPIDGHSPSLMGKGLSAYASAGIHTDHECSTPEEALARLRNGMYVQLRQGSACDDLRNLLKCVTESNSRHCILCSDDRSCATMFEKGDLDDHLRICVEEGIDPITAVQMASLNAADCYGLKDRGSLTPGKKADVVLAKDLKDFEITKVLIDGKLVAEDGKYLPEVVREDITPVMSSVRVKDFSKESLKLHLKNGHVRAIGIIPGGVVTSEEIRDVKLDDEGDFVFDPAQDVAKIAVIERHKYTGNVALALISNYGIKRGAIALTVAHDSHNIICVGTNNDDMEVAVARLIVLGGGAVVVNDGEVLASLPLPVGGLMSDQSGESVRDSLADVHDKAFNVLGVSREVEPLMTLCFMSLPVIPKLKLTDMGLFDVDKFDFVDVQADSEE